MKFMCSEIFKYQILGRMILELNKIKYLPILSYQNNMCTEYILYINIIVGS